MKFSDLWAFAAMLTHPKRRVVVATCSPPLPGSEHVKVLGPAERGRVWRSANPETSWLHYRWAGNHWRCYTGDPRSRQPGIISVPAKQPKRGAICRTSGFIEVH